MRIIKTLSLSTAHIMEKDDDVLHSIVEHGACDLIVISSEYGWTIIVPEDVIDTSVIGLSHAFWKLLLLAKEQGCSRLELDRDEDIDENLPRFEW